MKKLLLCVLVTLTVLLLISCNTEKPNETQLKTDAPTVTAAPETESPETEPPETKPPFDYEGYKALTPSPSGALKMFTVGYEDHSKVLSLPIPSHFATYMREDAFVLSCDGVEVGEIVSGTPEQAADTRIMDSTQGNIGDLSYHYRLLAIPTEADPARRYRHSFTYTYDVSDILYSVTLTVNYEALDANAVSNCTDNTKLLDKYSDAGLGTLLVNGQNKPRRVLVLGNSFVGTSELESFLKPMFSGSGYQVTAVSRGYACTHNGTWSDYLYQLREGSWDVLILCGFYHSEDKDALKNFIDACQNSKTQLVLFPAHNESREQEAIDAYPDIPVLHWQDEIDLLIDTLGIDYWDFCYNDSHKHSTPLAGYVGAHMIYRALTGHIPSATSFSYISTSTLRSLLGDYMTTGTVRLISDEDIWFLP